MAGVVQYGLKVYFEGSKGKERMVKMVHKEGTEFYDGESGKEHIVKIEFVNGLLAILQGPKHKERVVEIFETATMRLLYKGACTRRGCRSGRKHKRKDTLYTETELYCPISFEPMVDAVRLRDDGQLYSRASIEEWLKRKRTSPLHNTPITYGTLKEEHVIANAARRLRCDNSLF